MSLLGSMRRRLEPPQFEEGYDDFDAAASASLGGWAAHPFNSREGDFSPGLIDFEICTALAHIGARSVLDFGGGAGDHYLAAANVLPRPPAWTIVEVPERHAVIDGVTYVEDIPTKTQFDAVITSGALQYVRDPMDTLAAICSVARCGVLITRLPLCEHSDDDFVTVQNAYPGVRIPAWFFSAAKWRKEFLSSPWRIAWEWEGRTDSAKVRGKRFYYSGMLLLPR